MYMILRHSNCDFIILTKIYVFHKLRIKSLRKRDISLEKWTLIKCGNVFISNENY